MNIRTCSLLSLSFLFCIFFAISPAISQENSPPGKNYNGWEKDSEYGKLYDYKERDTLKGKIISFKKIVPLTGMAPGTAAILDEGEEKILVHICPWDFATPDQTGIKKGMKTKVAGCWALIDGKDVFIAAKVKQGDNFSFKVRMTKDGTPFWSMNEEELAQEKAE